MATTITIPKTLYDALVWSVNDALDASVCDCDSQDGDCLGSCTHGMAQAALAQVIEQEGSKAATYDELREFVQCVAAGNTEFDRLERLASELLHAEDHAAWVEGGMEGACPVCGDASGFHDDEGTCDAGPTAPEDE